MDVVVLEVEEVVLANVYVSGYVCNDDDSGGDALQNVDPVVFLVVVVVLSARTQLGWPITH
jgi:hypothetical protein